MTLLNPEERYNEDEKRLERLDPAWAKAALYFRIKIRFGHCAGELRGLSLVNICQQLEARKKRFESGDNMELLHAINFCGEENLPLPTWVATEFTSLFTKFLKSKDPTSLNSVFASNNLPSSQKRTRTVRRDWDIGVKLWWEVWSVADNHLSLDAALVSVLKGGDYGVGKTKERELVLMIDKN